MNTLANESTLWTGGPSTWRNRPILFLWCIVLVPVFGIGIGLYLIWWLVCINTKVTITNTRMILRRGILSKNTTEVHHKDVRNVIVRQRLLQRIFGVGYIGVSSAGQSGLEIEVRGIRSPQRLAKMIRSHAC